jgi:putative membrane protein
MLGNVIAAYVHFLAIITLGGILMAELVLYRQDITLNQARLLQRLDLHYLFAAILALGSGVARVLWFAKGPSFYLDNPVFWVKMGLFMAIALISVLPTVHYLRWSPRLKQGHRPEISDLQYRRIKRYLVAELVLLMLMPLSAVLMVRGIGM